MASDEAFYVVALGAVAAIGSSQSASRSLMALLTPKDREAEFFGFYDGLCGKASAVVGPLLYGLIADFTNERFAALCMTEDAKEGVDAFLNKRKPQWKGK